MKHMKRKCVVCQRIGIQSRMRIFPKNHWQKKAWVNAVRSTPEGRIALMKKISNPKAKKKIKKVSFLCSSHFSADAFTHYAMGTLLKPDAVPFFDDTTMQSSGEENLLQSTLDEANEIKEEPMEIKDEPIDDLNEIRQPMVDVFCPSTGTSRPKTDGAEIAKENKFWSYAERAMEDNFWCSECGQGYVTKTGLIYHINRHSGVPAKLPKRKRKKDKAKKLLCTQCGKKFISKGGFEYHMYRHAESGGIPFKHRPVDGTVKILKAIELPLANEVEVFSNSSGLSNMRYEAEMDANVPEHQSCALLEDAVEEEDMEEEAKVCEQKSYQLVEAAVKKEQIDDEEPGPSWALH
ncbi:hypothetical protein PMAYCL1PPCAC_05041 [Pristionchus mayeri]|uniref:THAP-type domain-containing protein n=1 Tax=Pristionchus mayeri TaxID=1317129 RepID=A0AAN4Z675_9BILA|nr:hypothetical protein PMAYCL1PPCAC_05041 [Pristionchus mayeri]